MASLRNLLVSAIKSFLKGKSFLQALLAYWISPAALKERTAADTTHHQQQQRGTVDESEDAGAGAAGATHNSSAPRSGRTIEDFLRDAEEQLVQPVSQDALRGFAAQLRSQLRERLWASPACMLPSYNHRLPNGSECGRYLALDVGGSTLRVALVELQGRGSLDGAEGGDETGSPLQRPVSRILRISTFRIDVDIKNLVGVAFFDWMAARIMETVSSALEEQENGAEKPIPMGLAWSFPIEQTSLKGGLLQGMGKGFLAADGLLGQDLGCIIEAACAKKGLSVELQAIINDSSATLLSESYQSPETRFGLILGTGFNIAVHLPVSTIDRPKFGTRPAGWFDKASHVIINTEMGMFGGGILPMTRWDHQLNSTHPKPDFQPLEHFVAGFYLGEIVRLALVEAIESTGIFGGVVPPSLLKTYSLDTETISIVESDDTTSLSKAIAAFSARHPSSANTTSNPSNTPTASDLAVVRTLASLVTRRSAALVAAAVFALWQLKAESETEYIRKLVASSPLSGFVEETKAELALDRVMVAFNGSVMEQYPGYQAYCQQRIEALLNDSAASSSTTTTPGLEAASSGQKSVHLVAAKESSLIGAAVALACLEEGKAN